ncbi:MAG: ABC transporter substrate-binding protein [Campylobacterota bacterium]|nr:ABC transporter substrate-binding protein [Campylobacterota bacterium]
MKQLLLTILTIFLSTNILSADIKSDISTQFNQRLDTALQVVNNKEIDKMTRNEGIIDAIKPMFDFELMAKLSIGRAWKSLDEQTQKNFVQTYVARMEKSYSEKIDTYTDEKVVIQDMIQPKANKAILITYLASKNDKLTMDYKFYLPKQQKQDKDAWLIYDVVIAGVSIIKADRAQFTEVLKTNDIHYLMDQMKK